MSEKEELTEIGVITQKVEKIAPDETWKRLAFTINDKVFSTFDVQFDEFEMNDVVRVTYFINDKGYNTISNMVLEEVSEPIPASAIPDPKKEQPKALSQFKNNQGKRDWTEDMIDFETLLNDAHKKGLTSIQTELISIDWEKQRVLFKAIVKGFIKDETGKIVTRGEFIAYGDAIAMGEGENIKSAMIKPHWIRMGETRSIARALRFYTNNAKVSREEADALENLNQKADDY